MGHYDNCREGYCPKCGAGPGNIKNGKCVFCDDTNMLEKINKPINLRKEGKMSGHEQNQYSHQFELEQEILECWGITEDLNVVSRAETLEEAKDLVEAIVTLYEQKFSKCFETYETYIRSKNI